MKHSILLVLLSLLAVCGWAAPAMPVLTAVRLSDGSTLRIRQHGDEHFHWTTTADGLLLSPRGDDYFVADIDAQGHLLPTAQLAHEPELRGAEELRLAARQQLRRPLFERQQAAERARRRSLAVSATVNYFPHTGTPRALVILAAYQDLPFTVNSPVEAFDQLLNGDAQLQDLGNHNQMAVGSVRQYFEASSQGAFSPRFDVVGPVVLPKAMADYGSTENMLALCSDAVAQLEGQVDFSRYDNDGDGHAELVYIIHAGYGENQGGPASAMWAKTERLALSVASQEDTPVVLEHFSCCAELFNPAEGFKDYINGNGVFIHEFSHAMGLPDLYATASSGYVNNQGMEYYDVMDMGLYCRNGFAPITYRAWEQDVMGWLPMEPLPASGRLSLLPTSEAGGQAYKIANSDNPRECIVLENVQKRGQNGYARGHGLLVYHVAYPTDVVSMNAAPNNIAGHPGVALVPAGGLLISSRLAGTGKEYSQADLLASMAAAPFPGTAAVAALSDDSRLPNYLFYASASAASGQADYVPVGVTLTDIAEDTEQGTVSFRIADAGAALPGDADGDGLLTTADLIAIAAIAAANGYDPQADANGDGLVNIADIVAVSNALVP